MSIALRKQLVKPDTSYGPLRFIEASPWLILAAALRVIAFDGGPMAVPAIVCANIAVLQAFVLVAHRSIEMAQGHTRLGSLGPMEQFRLSRAIFGRIVLLMIVACFSTGYVSGVYFEPLPLLGVDGMAFDQHNIFTKFWSAVVATLVLLMIVRADATDGKVRFFAALAEFARRWIWLCASILFLGAIYIGLGFLQGLVRDAIWAYWQTSSDSQFLKNLVFFVFIFSFAMLRLWITLLVLTFGLKQSYKN